MPGEVYSSENAAPVSMSAPDWECSKENVKPLKAGRKLKGLRLHPAGEGEVESGGGDNLTVQQRLEAEERAFEDKIATAAAPGGESAEGDQLDVWIKYLAWVRQNFPSDTKRSLLILERCTEAFKASESHRNDPRYVKVWVEYADLVATPGEVFAFMQSNKIGERVALFWVAWAFVAEKHENFALTDKIFQKGIQKRAEPKEVLAQRYQQFQRRMARHYLNMASHPPPATTSAPTAASGPASEPRQIQQLPTNVATRTQNGGGAPMGSLSRSGATVSSSSSFTVTADNAPPGLPKRNTNSAGFDIFTDAAPAPSSLGAGGAPGDAAGYLNENANWKSLAKQEVTKKENSGPVSKWSQGGLAAAAGGGAGSAPLPPALPLPRNAKLLNKDDIFIEPAFETNRDATPIAPSDVATQPLMGGAGPSLRQQLEGFGGGAGTSSGGHNRPGLSLRASAKDAVSEQEKLMRDPLCRHKASAATAPGPEAPAAAAPEASVAPGTTSTMTSSIGSASSSNSSSAAKATPDFTKPSSAAMKAPDASASNEEPKYKQPPAFVIHSDSIGRENATLGSHGGPADSRKATAPAFTIFSDAETSSSVSRARPTPIAQPHPAAATTTAGPAAGFQIFSEEPKRTTVAPKPASKPPQPTGFEIFSDSAASAAAYEQENVPKVPPVKRPAPSGQAPITRPQSREREAEEARLLAVLEGGDFEDATINTKLARMDIDAMFFDEAEAVGDEQGAEEVGVGRGGGRPVTASSGPAAACREAPLSSCTGPSSHSSSTLRSAQQQGFASPNIADISAIPGESTIKFNLTTSSVHSIDYSPGEFSPPALGPKNSNSAATTSVARAAGGSASTKSATSASASLAFTIFEDGAIKAASAGSSTKAKGSPLSASLQSLEYSADTQLLSQLASSPSSSQQRSKPTPSLPSTNARPVLNLGPAPSGFPLKQPLQSKAPSKSSAPAFKESSRLFRKAKSKGVDVIKTIIPFSTQPYETTRFNSQKYCGPRYYNDSNTDSIEGHKVTLEHASGVDGSGSHSPHSPSPPRGSPPAPRPSAAPSAPEGGDSGNNRSNNGSNNNGNNDRNDDSSEGDDQIKNNDASESIGTSESNMSSESTISSHNSIKSEMSSASEVTSQQPTETMPHKLPPLPFEARTGPTKRSRLGVSIDSLQLAFATSAAAKPPPTLAVVNEALPQIVLPTVITQKRVGGARSLSQSSFRPSQALGLLDTSSSPVSGPSDAESRRKARVTMLQRKRKFEGFLPKLDSLQQLGGRIQSMWGHGPRAELPSTTSAPIDSAESAVPGDLFEVTLPSPVPSSSRRSSSGSSGSSRRSSIDSLQMLPSPPRPEPQTPLKAKAMRGGPSTPLPASSSSEDEILRAEAEAAMRNWKSFSTATPKSRGKRSRLVASPEEAGLRVAGKGTLTPTRAPLQRISENILTSRERLMSSASAALEGEENVTGMKPKRFRIEEGRDYMRIEFDASLSMLRIFENILQRALHENVTSELTDHLADLAYFYASVQDKHGRVRFPGEYEAGFDEENTLPAPVIEAMPHTDRPSALLGGKQGFQYGAQKALPTRPVPLGPEHWVVLQRFIGKGAFGDVLLAKQSSFSSEPVAIKIDPKRVFCVWEGVIHARLLQRLRESGDQHDRVTYQSHFLAPLAVLALRDASLLLSAYCELGDLVSCANYLNSVYQGRTHELIAVVIIQQMLEAVHFLHSRHVLHGDIKLNNWLIRGPPKGLAAGPTQGINICLIDFGKSCDVFEFHRQSASTSLPPSEAALTAFEHDQQQHTAAAPGENKPGQTWSPRRSIYERDLRGTANTVYNLVFGREARYRAVPYSGLEPPRPIKAAAVVVADPARQRGQGRGQEKGEGGGGVAPGRTAAASSGAARLYHGLDVPWALESLLAIVSPPYRDAAEGISGGSGGGQYDILRDTDLNLDLPAASLNAMWDSKLWAQVFISLLLPHSNGPASRFHTKLYRAFTDLGGARYHEVHLACLSAILDSLQAYLDARLREEQRVAAASSGLRVYPSAHSSVARCVAAFAAGLRNYHATLVESGRA